MSNNSAAKATLNVYQTLFSALDTYFGESELLTEGEVHELTQKMLSFFLERGFDPEIDLTVDFNLNRTAWE